MLTAGDVSAFAVASGDRNPLHVDERFARRTPFGRPVVHGALLLTVALGAAPAAVLERLRTLSVRFLRPLHCRDPFTVRYRADRDELRVVAGGALAMQATLGSAAAPRPVAAADGAPADAAPQAEPVTWTLERLAEAPPWSRRYRPDLPALRVLADRLGATTVPDAVLGGLACASWVVGMQVPGRHALFAGLHLDLDPATDPGADAIVTMTVRDTDARTRSVEVDAHRAGVAVRLSTFLLAPPPAVDRAAVRRHLPPSATLAGRRVLVVGGSRGFGAAVAGALADQGAHVRVGWVGSEDRAGELRAAFGDRIEPVRLDATDPDQVAAAVADVGDLDGLVLTATPALRDVPLHPAAVEDAVAFVGTSVEMALRPLVAALPGLAARDGWVVVVSSAAVHRSPAAWTHYAAAKAAVESVADSCARHHRVRTLVLRAPKMWTDLTNGPTACLQAVPPTRVAADVVRWVVDPPGGPNPTVLEPAGPGRTHHEDC